MFPLKAPRLRYNARTACAVFIIIYCTPVIEMDGNMVLHVFRSTQFYTTSQPANESALSLPTFIGLLESA